MGLFDNKDVYCQMCGEKISDLAYVSDARNAYHPTSKCIPWKTPDENYLEVRNKEEIQKDIREGKLVHYSPLEKSISR